MAISTDIGVVTTTVATESEASKLAMGLLEAKLVACVQIEGPICSRYHWQGVIETAMEYRLVCKTRPTFWEDIQAYVATHHPYQLPQLVMLTGVGSHAYGAWVGDSIQVGGNRGEGGGHR